MRGASIVIEAFDKGVTVTWDGKLISQIDREDRRSWDTRHLMHKREIPWYELEDTMGGTWIVFSQEIDQDAVQFKDRSHTRAEGTNLLAIRSHRVLISSRYTHTRQELIDQLDKENHDWLANMDRVIGEQERREEEERESFMTELESL